MTLAQKQARLAAITARLEALRDAAQTDNRDLTEQELAEIDSLATEFDKLQSQIDAVRGIGARGALARQSTGRQTAPNPIGGRAAAGERWIDSKTGESIPVLGGAERLTDSAPQSAARPAAQLGQIVRAVATGRWTPEVQAGMVGGADSDGGYMLTPYVSSQVIDLARARSVCIAAGARTIPMVSSELRLVRVESDPTPGWRGEGTAVAVSKPVLGAVTLRARSLGVIVPVSLELLEDAANAPEVVEGLIAAAMGLELDRACLRGAKNGEEPTGLRYVDGALEEAAIGNLEYDDYIQAMGDVEDENGETTAILHSPQQKAYLAMKKDNTGQYVVPPASYSETPRLVSTQVPDDESFVGDFRQMLIGVRSEIRVRASEDAGASSNQGFAKAQVLIRALMRVDVAFARPNHLKRLLGITLS